MADRFGGRRMKKHWHVIAGTSKSFSVDATHLGGGLALDDAWTAIRMLGEYIVSPDQAPAAQDAASVGFGIGVVSSAAFAVGLTAVPDPIAQPDYPWLYWASHDFFFPDTSLTGASPTRSLRRSFDIRSMRKIKPQETLAFVIQYANTAGNPPLQVEVSQTRVLVAG